MKPETVVLTISFLIISTAMLYYYIRQPQPIKTFLLGSLSGVAALAFAKFFFFLAGITLPLSWFSLVLSALLGIPGVLTLSVIQLLL